MPAKLLKFLLCDRNLYAVGASCAVTVLYLLGIIDAWWWLIAAAAYAAVWLLPIGPETKVESKPIDLSTEASLQWLRDNAMPKLPASARDILSDLIERAHDLMPRLKEMEGAGLVQATNRAELKQTVKIFLPQAVEAYLRLPPLYARTARVADGQTAEDLLLGQLRTLQAHVETLQAGILSAEVDTLLAQSRFLNQRLAQPVSVLESAK
ncbi:MULTISPECIES: hypothetical protein [unclassified Variovorax]|uniref:hypothetical protein n=1 Tax=unclassified Variovorax TaxID=663243 RepID=UPI0013178FD9|nr:MULTISPECIES: hypothetical protein [unclassified Variovorax]VTU42938.1 hypothetical protein H6P1_00317 [Variovorax sp. PBL-H6]VTU43572.1 hypothetical protein SRS16P1_00588 [Variovorax sp. SRS16]VTU43633.1 hypothetical protein E5P1_00582 [Variovorax sp. PBL-E5]